MKVLLVLMIVVIIAIISVAINTKKDNKIQNKLKINLAQKGFICTDSIEILDSFNQGKPMTFMVDINSRKWVLALFHAENSEVYNFSDIENYTVIYREKTNNITKGNEMSVSALSHNTNKNSIMETLGISEHNCEYIEIRLNLKGSAKNDRIRSNMVLFEEQRTFLNARNNDFLIPHVCINNAKSFEALLYYIIQTNTKEQGELYVLS